MPLRLRFAVPFVLILSMVAPTLVARPVTVVMKDGRRIDAELIRETSDAVVVEIIEGAQTTFDRSDIDEIETRKSMDQIYRERREKLQDDDLEGRYELAYFLFQNRAYELAEAEIRSILKDFPDADRPLRLLRVLEERQKTARPDEERPSEEADAGDGEQPERRGLEKSPPPEPLSMEQISMIRLWELPTGTDAMRELSPRVRIADAVIEKFIEQYRDRDDFPLGDQSLNRLRSAQGYEQLLLMMDMRAREFYDDVLILDDPPAMREFRRTVHPSYVWNYFAPRFGLGQLDDLRLIRRGRATSPENTYTNFLILHNYSREGQQMINRSNPVESLLLQWGLPRDEARHPAPDVPGWRPIFSGAEDRNFQQYVEWIRSLYPDPKYGVTIRRSAEADSGANEELDASAEAVD